MTSRLVSLSFAANDPGGLAAFWARTLGWEHVGTAVQPTDGTSFGLVFIPVEEPKTAKNPIHLDLVSESAEHQQEVVDRLIGLGARHVDIGQGEVSWVVLADPEGNEFCVLVRGEFTADTGFLASIVFEPAEVETAYFWGKAIGWPVVYDKDGDVAIRAPEGGPFITFGPPGVAETGSGRLSLDLHTDGSAEVDRLIALGARLVEHVDASWTVLADPNGNEFRVLAR